MKLSKEKGPIKGVIDNWVKNTTANSLFLVEYIEQIGLL